MTLVKNIGAAERWIRVIGGGVLVVLGLNLAGWAGWVSALAGLALLATSAFRY